MQTFWDSKHLAEEKQLDQFLVAAPPDVFSPRGARGCGCLNSFVR